MEQIMCLCLFASAVCAAFFMLGAIFEYILPERLTDWLISFFMGEKRSCPENRGSKNKINNLS